MPFFSIIIPVYNTQDFLNECLNSILFQKFTDYECILIDDGSTDNSSILCDEIALRDDRFTTVHQKNGGQAKARNSGIILSKGDYIVFLDSDDTLYDNSSFDNLYNLIKMNNSTTIFHSNIFSFASNYNFPNLDIIESNIVSIDTKTLVKIKICNPSLIFGIWSFTVKRDILINNKLFFKEGILHEDSHLIPRLLCCIEDITINHNYFYKYRRQRPGSSTYVMNSKRLIDFLIIINDFLSINSSNGDKNNILSYFCKNYWLRVFRVLYNYEENNNEIYNHILNELNKTIKCILYQISFRELLIFIIIKFFGLNNTIKIRNFLFSDK